jgi:CheY-like chemotaxis protein
MTASAICSPASCASAICGSARRRTATGALALAEQMQFDLVILDVMMPGLDGFEVTEQAARKRPDADPAAHRAR